MNINIAEQFTSIQGEGHLTGQMMRFIRLAGCSIVQCPLHPSNKSARGVCDTDWKYKAKESAQSLADTALSEVGAGGWVSVTGGEPLDQSEGLSSLVTELRKRNLRINMQTSGTRSVLFNLDWLTVSPKCAAPFLTQNLGHELKLVYSGQSDEEIIDYYDKSKFWHYYLMPLWSDGSQNVSETIQAIGRLNKAGQNWKLTTQAHKWWKVR